MNRNLAWKIISSILIVLALLTGVFLYLQGIKDEQKPQESVISSPTPQVNTDISPTPAVSEVVDLSMYKIQVLNGSGISGEAARAKQLLEEEKFTVSSIGNADTVNYQKTIIQVKKTVSKEFLDKLKGFIDKSYVLDDTKELDESEKSDVLIIVGSEKVSE